MSKDSVEFIRKLVACPELTESDIDVALTAAGVDELLPDGNRKLSQLGLAATGFLIDSSIAFITLSRGIHWQSVASLPKLTPSRFYIEAQIPCQRYPTPCRHCKAYWHRQALEIWLSDWCSLVRRSCYSDKRPHRSYIPQEKMFHVRGQGTLLSRVGLL